MKQNTKILILILISFLPIVGIFFFAPIAQDLNYHNFCDKRELLTIINCFNVISNIPYWLVGIIGIYFTLKYKNDSSKFEDSKEIITFLIAFFGIFLVGFGSSYYHLSPDNHTLVWDRLPMTIGFMAIFSMILGERISLKLGLFLLPILLLIGLFSIYYWNYTENIGRGDLRLYALVQFLPLILIPLIISLFPAKYSGTCYLFEVIFWYIIAKILEYFDYQIFDLTHQVISGHSLKHLASAIATYGIVRYLRNRKVIA